MEEVIGRGQAFRSVSTIEERAGKNLSEETVIANEKFITDFRSGAYMSGLCWKLMECVSDQKVESMSGSNDEG